MLVLSVHTALNLYMCCEICGSSGNGFGDLWLHASALGGLGQCGTAVRVYVQLYMYICTDGLGAGGAVFA